MRPKLVRVVPKRLTSAVPVCARQVKISIRTASAQANGNVLVTIHCEGKPDKLVTRKQVVDALREEVVDGSKIGADVSPDKIQIDGPKDCVEGGSIQSRLRGADVPKPQPSDEVRALQAQLCVPYFDVDGLWGRNTQRALEAWRGKTGSRAAGKPLSDAERKALLAADPASVAKWCAG